MHDTQESEAAAFVIALNSGDVNRCDQCIKIKCVCHRKKESEYRSKNQDQQNG